MELQRDNEDDKQNASDGPQRDDSSGTEWVDDAAEGERDGQAGGTSEEDDGVDPVNKAQLLGERLGRVGVDTGEQDEVHGCKESTNGKIDVKPLAKDQPQWRECEDGKTK